MVINTYHTLPVMPCISGSLNPDDACSEVSCCVALQLSFIIIGQYWKYGVGWLLAAGGNDTLQQIEGDPTFFAANFVSHREK